MLELGLFSPKDCSIRATQPSIAKKGCSRFDKRISPRESVRTDILTPNASRTYTGNKALLKV